jgi:hypothetical protein
MSANHSYEVRAAPNLTVQYDLRVGKNALVDGTFGARALTGAMPAAANTTMTVSQSGTKYTLPAATANNTITLPALTAGLEFEFYLSAVPNGTNTHTITSGAANMQGHIIAVAAGLVPTTATGRTNIILGATAANAKVGDYCKLWCDGTNWYYSCLSSGTAAAWSTS